MLRRGSSGLAVAGATAVALVLGGCAGGARTVGALSSPTPSPGPAGSVADRVSMAPTPTVTPPRGASPTSAPRVVPTTAAGVPVPARLQVRGASLRDGAGRVVRLLGVNRSGSEYACADNGGYANFDGPDDQASVSAMLTWQVNAVRVPLNEQCWLGAQGISPQFSGPAYRAAIGAYVARLSRNGLYALLDLHIASASDRVSPTVQAPMPDAAHAVAFWRSVASQFREEPRVVFDVYNEPYGVDWPCWRDGCQIEHPTDPAGHPLPAYRAAGMAELVRAIRGVGAGQLVLAGGLGYANDLTEWLRYRPADPVGNLAASYHIYPNPACTPQRCDGGVPLCAPADCAGGPGVLPRVAAQVPVVVGEVGEYDCTHRYVDQQYDYFDQLKLSYLGWAWDAGGGWKCDTGPSLITDYDGTPTAYGVGLRDHLRALARHRSS